MDDQPDWTGWVVGEVRFGSGALDRWRKAALARPRCDGWPAWIAPGPAAVGTVESELRAIEAYARERDQASVWRAEYVSIAFGPDRVRFGAHLGPMAFDFWGGQLAALAASAEEVGAQGEVAFIERPGQCGHCVRLDGKGPTRVGPFDEAAFDRWRSALEQLTKDLPPEGTYKRRFLPMTELHRELGGVFEGSSPWGIPDHYGAGYEAELARIDGDYGVFDLSPMAAVALDVRVAKDVLRRMRARPLAKLGGGRVAWGRLLDPDTGAVDRVLGWNDGKGHLVVFGTQGMELHLGGWFQRRTSRQPAVALDVTDHWGRLAFVGPAAAQLFASFGDKVLGRLKVGRVKSPAPREVAEGAIVFRTELGQRDAWIVVAEVAALEPLLRAHRERLCGARAWEDARFAESDGSAPVRVPRRADGSPDRVAPASAIG